jgi:hypothetical protein
MPAGKRQSAAFSGLDTAVAISLNLQTLSPFSSVFPPVYWNSNGTGFGTAWFTSPVPVAAPEMSGRNRFAVALMGQQFDEPGFVLDLLI